MLLSRRMLTALFVLCLCGSVAKAQVNLDDINPFGDDAGTTDTGTDGLLDDTPVQPAGPEETQKTFDDYYKDAEALAAEGKCAEAIEVYSQILAANPNYFPAYVGRGKCLAELGENELALESLTSAVSFAARYPAIFAEASAERGKVLLQLGQYQEAADDFSAAVQSNPSDAEFLYYRGKSFMKLASLPQTGFGQQDYVGQAISSLSRSIELDENYAEAYSERGNAYAAQGRYDKSVDDLEQASELDGETSKTKAQLGFVLLRRAEFEKNKYDAELDSVVADYQSAIDAFSEYLKIEGDREPEEYEDIEDPEFVKPGQVYLGRALAKISMADEQGSAGQSGLYQSAIDDTDKVLEFDEASVAAVYQKGVAKRMMGDLEGAVDTFTDALDMAPQYSDALLRRGICYYYLNELESARGDFNQVTALSEIPDGRSDFWIGVTFAKDGNYEEAIRMYTRAIRLNPAYKPAYNNRGLALMKVGRYDRAALDFEELIRRNRKDTVARQRRDMARQMMNQQR